MDTATQSRNYSFRHMPLKELRIDPKVQRDLDERHVKRLADKWNPQFTGCLTGSLRSNGRVYLTDGQQRRAAGMLVDPHMQLPVMVYEDWTPVTEGEAFLAVNRDNKNVPTYDKYKVAVGIGHTPEAEIDRLLNSLDLSVARLPRENALSCPATLIRISKFSDWENILTWTLNYMRDAGFNVRDDNPWEAVFVESLAIFIRTWHKHEAWDDEIVVGMFMNDPFFRNQKILVQAARMRAEGNNRAVGAGAELLREYYNKRTRSPKKKLK